MKWQRQKSLETIIDPRLNEKYSPESLTRFGEIAEKCLAEEGKSRPTMGEVLWHLEYVLQIQEAWLSTIAAEMSFTGSQPLELPDDNDTTELDKEGGLDKPCKNGESAAVTADQPDQLVVGGSEEFPQISSLQGR